MILCVKKKKKKILLWTHLINYLFSKLCFSVPVGPHNIYINKKLQAAAKILFAHFTHHHPY